MAKTLSPRFGLQRWSADGDTQQRSEFDSDAAQLEALALKVIYGDQAARPAANAGAGDNDKTLHVATTGTEAGRATFSDGATWRDLISKVTKLLVAPTTADGGITIQLAAGASLAPLDVKSSGGGTLVSIGADGYLTAGNSALITTTAAGRGALVVKGVAAQSADLTQWQSATAVVAGVDPGGRGYFGRVSAVGSGSGAALTAQPVSTAQEGLIVRGLSAQSANLAEFQDSAGGVKASVSASGRAVFGDSASIGIGSRLGTNSSSVLTVATGSAGNEGLIVRGYTGQAQNLAEFQKVDGTPLVVVGNGTSAVAFTVNEPPGLSINDTGVVVAVSNVGSRRVVCGAADSAGVGFRTLRISN